MLVERMQHFVLPVSAANVQPQLGLTVRVDLDAPFRLFGVVIWNLGVVAGTGCEGQIAIRIQRPDGRTIQRQITASNQLFPGNQYNQTGISPNKAWACPIHPGVLFPAGSVIELDVMGLPTGIDAPQGSIVVFVGTNIYQQGNVWSPAYPKKWTARTYLDNLTVQNIPFPGGLPVLSQPFTAQADSDFVWQAGLYTDGSPGSTTATLLYTVPESGGLLFTAVTPGAAGNAITIQFVVAGDNTPFSIVVTGNAILVNCATDGFGVVTTTWLDAQTAMNADADVTALVGVSEGGGLFVAVPFGPTHLSGGSGGRVVLR